MRYATLLGHVVDVETDGALERFYDQILAAENGTAAEDLAYGAKNPLAAGLARGEHDLPIWTAAQLRDPRWVYLQDAVARCRAAHGELDVASVMRAATWDSAEAARSLGVTEASVRRLVADGDLPAVSISGRYMIDRSAVEAFVTAGTRAGRTDRVPALYLRAGTIDGARLVAAVVGEGVSDPGYTLHTSVDGVDEITVTSWREAVILWGKGDKARAVQIRPAHSRPANRIAFDSLAAVGRWEIIDKTNNRGEAQQMLVDAFGRGGMRLGEGPTRG
jgi:excisionase family DNA binding protein